MEKLSFYINQKNYSVNIIRKNIKHLYLKITKQQIVATVPQRTSISIVKSFVNLHIEKFVWHLENNKHPKFIDLDNKYVYLFGKKYHLKIGNFKKTNITVFEEEISLNLSNTSDENLSKILNKFVKLQLKEYLQVQVIHYEKLMKTKHHQIKVVNKFSNWASNIIHRNCLSFSSKLAHFSKSTIDYVIVHELTHDFETNHGIKFWKKIAEFYPDYKLQIKNLKKF